MDGFQGTELNKLVKELKNCTQLHYNGQLNIQDSQGKHWNLYYELGQIIWSTGGTHPYRRWLRNITHHCPELDIDNIQYSSESQLIDYWDYLLLENLYATQKINQQQTNNIIESTISEILFDLISHKNLSCLCFQRNQEMILKSPLISTHGNMFIEQMQKSWHNWEQAGLNGISPYLAPILRKPEQLQVRVDPLIYNQFERLINGRYTLWDLATRMKRNVLSITTSLFPFIKEEIMELIEVPDLPLPTNQVDKRDELTQANTVNPPVIACIDDSPLVCKILERIVTSRGMKFIAIQNPIQALAILMVNQPDLIFLDLMMPTVNGYEICNQLRRYSCFAKTPVVILTGSDGVFDRVRSKVFGATEFISKPIQTDTVVAMLYKYLNYQKKIENGYNLVVS